MVQVPLKSEAARLRGPFADGARRIRTADLLGAIQALCQLSYSPSGEADEACLALAQGYAVAVELWPRRAMQGSDQVGKGLSLRIRRRNPWEFSTTPSGSTSN